MKYRILIFFTLTLQNIRPSVESSIESGDVASALSPHGRRISHRQVRECMEYPYGNRTHETYPADRSPGTVTTRAFIEDYGPARRLYGHVSVARDPLRTVTVLEPLAKGGCAERRRATVAESARQKQCQVAVNAGFFNTDNGECLGNMVSDGELVVDSGGVQNAHFGMRRSGQLFWGYLSQEDLLDRDDPFEELVGGVIWLLRDGQVYINQSMAIECDDTEETGTAREFVEVISGRSAVGHDAEGRLVLLQVDGQTHVTGVNLWEMAEILQRLGVVNAINLDGGGSTTFTQNTTTANYPSDLCPGEEAMFRCPREVSSILCVHPPECDPPDCGGHGQCVEGLCQCQPLWNSSEDCSRLACPHLNCSQHGQCTAGGCVCDAGWEGEGCQRPCQAGLFGFNCSQRCQCQQGGATCTPDTGHCLCPPGFVGTLCQNRCPYGYYGDGCGRSCACGDKYCPCDHVTGLCNLSSQVDLYKSSQCLAMRIIKGESLVPQVPLTYNPYFWGFLTAVGVAAVSLLLNLLTFCYSCRCSCATLTGGRGRGSERRSALGHYQQVHGQDIPLHKM